MSKWNGVSTGGAAPSYSKVEQDLTSNSSYTPSTAGIYSAAAETQADFIYMHIESNHSGTWRISHDEFDSRAWAHGMVVDGSSVRYKNTYSSTQYLTLICMEYGTVTKDSQSVSDNGSYTPSYAGYYTAFALDSILCHFVDNVGSWRKQGYANGTWRNYNSDLSSDHTGHGHSMGNGSNIRYNNDCGSTQPMFVLYVS